MCGLVGRVLKLRKKPGIQALEFLGSLNFAMWFLNICVFTVVWVYACVGEWFVFVEE